jgi:tetratricopeptide (TPR) repeat protein
MFGWLASYWPAMDDLIAQAQRSCDDGAPSVRRYAELAKLQEQAGLADSALANYLTATLLQATELAPHDAASWLQLGLALHRQHRSDRARAAFRAASLLRPAMAEAHNNLGGLAEGEAAIAPLRRAVTLAPASADYHTNLAHALLAAGHLAEGFREWEWRTPSPRRDFAQPRWQGQRLNGQTLLVHAEQGYGDSIQFSRYLEAAAAMGGRLVVETRAPLAGLLRRLPAVGELVLWGDPLPPFDWQIPMPSLAALFPPPPWQGPYLSADPAKSADWRRAVAARDDGRRRIGLVWSGNPRGHDPLRAMPFDIIADWAATMPQIQFFGLQRELPEQASGAIIQLGAGIADFDDLAGAVTAMDLLISVDTAAAHLAAALGRPVWPLLHNAADWRWWGPTPDASIWYPSARLFRQDQPGDWAGVLRQVGAALSTYSSR